MKIGIVNDLSIIAECLRRAVISTSEHEVAWIAYSGAEAVRLCAQQTPDLILMDLIMPGINGVETIRQIMKATPCAILVVTATVKGSVGLVFEALGAGAVDAVNTPVLSGPEGKDGVRVLLMKIAQIGKIAGMGLEGIRRSGTLLSKRQALKDGWLFAIGTSAGGPAALAEMLGVFPVGAPAAFVVIQHLDRNFAPSLADWLGGQISMPVRLAREGDVPEPGVVLLPSREDHLVLNPQGALFYTAEPKDYVYRPSIDAFFASVADQWKGNAAGILLTGMGRDGAQGLKKMRDAGFPTIAQDQKTSAVYGMPKAAAQIGAAERILPLPEIGPILRQLL
jgi:two-component system response regulator WspF